MVRDNQFRKMNPATTIGIWPKVLAGEDKWINPFRDNADATFDSYLEYELAVLKPYVGGLLERARLELGPVPQVVNMIRLMSAVVATFPDAVPGDSIIRETIGGSQLEY
jgi:uridine kinase